MDEIEKLNEERVEKLIFRNKEIAEKYVYYLLAADAACVAFAIDQGKKLTLSIAQIPLGVAVLCWGFSFFNGLKQIQAFERYITLNVIQLKLSIKNSHLGHKQYNELNSLDEKIYKLRNKQNIYFGLGILAFLIWNIVRMYYNQPPVIIHQGE